MYLNNFNITDRSVLKENFLPFRDVWENILSGLYQECLRENFESNALISEILDITKRMLNGAAHSTQKLEELYNKFAMDNMEAIRILSDKIEKTDDGCQKDVLYLCVLMHIHAGHKHMTDETVRFVSDILVKKAVRVPTGNNASTTNISAQTFCVIKGEAYHLDSAGKIVSLCGTKPLMFASELKNIISFSYTDKLGLIAADCDGVLHIRNAPTAIAVPNDVKIVGVSAYLSNYMLLSVDGIAYTNIKMDTSEWTNLRYIYVGLNSVCGVKNGSGAIVSMGGNAKLKTFTDVAKVSTYRDEQSRFIVLHKNGIAEDDEGEIYDNVITIAIAEGGYYYASDHTIYRRMFGSDKIEACIKTKGSIHELYIVDGKIFYL